MDSFRNLTTEGEVFETKNILSSPLITFTDKNNYHESVKGKSVLVLGGGPTSMLYDWSEIKYDHLWTLNSFYQNKLYKDLTFDLIHIGSLIDPNDSKLIEYLDSKGSNAQLYYELAFYHGEKYSRLFSSGILEKYKERSNYYVTEFRGRIGGAPRLVLLAAFMGASDVYFTGIDGYTKDNKRLHSFWKGALDEIRTDIPAQAKEHGGDAAHTYNESAIDFKEYLNLLNKISNDIGTKFYNLGEGHEANMIGDLYRDMLPLPSNLKQL